MPRLFAERGEERGVEGGGRSYWQVKRWRRLGNADSGVIVIVLAAGRGGRRWHTGY